MRFTGSTRSDAGRGAALRATAAIAALVLLAITVHARQSKGIEPVLDRVTLAVPGAVLEPAGVLPGLPDGTRAGDLVLDLASSEQRAVRALRRRDGKLLWRAEHPEGKGISCYAATSAMAYCRWWYQVRDEFGFDRLADGPDLVRRLWLADGTWVAPLRVPFRSEYPEGVTEEVWEVEATRYGVFVLSGTDVDEWHLERGIKGLFRVTCFGGDRVMWSREFTLEGVAHWSWSSDLSRLTLLGDQILVLGSDTDPLISLSTRTGEEQWRLPRVWEFTRHYVGKFVFRHHMVRGHDEDADWLNGSRAHGPADSPEFRDESYEAGPVVVPAGEGHSIFLAVSRNREREGHNIDCDLYQISSIGNPVAMLRLPRSVRPESHFVTDEGLVWCLARQGLVGIGAEPTGDAVCDLHWFRKHRPVVPDGTWLVYNRYWPRVELLHRHHLLRVEDGAYVRKPEDRTLVLPVSRTDVRTGQEISLVLTIPFRGGRADRPASGGFEMKTENSSSSASGGSDQDYSIMGLEARDGRLLVHVRWTSDRRFTLAFDAEPIFR